MQRKYRGFAESSQLRILYLHQVPLTEEMANVIQVVQMCRAFQRNGADVTLLAPALERHRIATDAAALLGKRIGVNPDFRLCTVAVRNGSRRIKGLSMYVKAKKVIKQMKGVDVCFTRSVFMAHLSLSLGFPTIYESHGSRFHQRSRLLDLLYRRLILRDARNPNLLLFITISRALERIWKEHGVPIEKLLTLHDAVSEGDCRNGLSRKEARKKLGIVFDGKVVVYAGSLYQDRSIETLVRLAENLKDTFFLIVGGPESQRTVYTIKAEKRRLKNIRFTGYVQHQCVKDYLAAGDVLLMIWSSKVPTINVCSPLKVFEYMAAGRIIVGHGYPTIREVLEDNETAILCQPDSYEDLEFKLRRALSMDYPNPMAQKANQMAIQRYSWEERTRTILNRIEGHIATIRNFAG
jgi:glycosyltransferase involved in cell wall biosynthesis